jgi:hypothetical protein
MAGPNFRKTAPSKEKSACITAMIQRSRLADGEFFGIADDEVGFGFLGGPRWREAAEAHFLQSSSSRRFAAGAAGFLDLHPTIGATGAIWRAETLRDDALTTERTGVCGSRPRMSQIRYLARCLEQRRGHGEAERGSRFENNVPPPTRHRCVRDFYWDRTRVSPRRSRCIRAPELG